MIDRILRDTTGDLSQITTSFWAIMASSQSDQRLSLELPPSDYSQRIAVVGLARGRLFQE